jgi:hypothetical protein
MDQLEAPDQPIPLARAAEIAGLSYATVRVQADRGKLETIRYGHERLTTRRLLHRYLMARDGSRGGKPAPLPPDYRAPE